MAKIKTIEELRDHALDTLNKLADGSIDVAEAGVTGKLCESVISTVKTQLDYYRMIQEQPQIAFMGNHLKAIEGEVMKGKLLESPMKKR